MIPVSINLAQDDPKSSAKPAQLAGDWLEFAGYLARKHSITGDLVSKFGPAEGSARSKKLYDLWEITELSASDFADEVARFYKLPRVSLPQMVAASSLAGRFSRRFLREMALYPCRTDGVNTIALADPTDNVALRAAEIVLGGPVAVAVASFEDVATV